MNLSDLALKFKNLSPEAKHWAERFVWLCLLVLAFFLGRLSTTSQVTEVMVEDTTRVEETQRLLKLATEELTHWQTVANKKTVTKSVPKLLACPDGKPILSHETTTTTEENTDSKGGSKGSSTATEDSSLTKKEDVHKKAVTKPEDKWLVGVVAGGQTGTPLIPISGQLVLGASVDYRIAGPVWVGATVHTGGSLLGQVKFSFPNP